MKSERFKFLININNLIIQQLQRYFETMQVYDKDQN